MLVDFNKMKEHYDGDIEIIGQLIEIFEDSYPETLTSLKEAVGSSDFTNIHLHAHTLKGMIANFFADDLKNAAFEIEKCGSDKSLTGDLQEHLEKLESEIPNMIAEIKKM